MRKTPEKGQPDFSNLDDKRVREYRDVVNEMLGAFSEFPEEKEVLMRVWKCLSNECADRTYNSPDTIRTRPTVFKRSRSAKLVLDKF